MCVVGGAHCAIRADRDELYFCHRRFPRVCGDAYGPYDRLESHCRSIRSGCVVCGSETFDAGHVIETFLPSFEHNF
jgi:hypothetical protein